MGQAGDTGEKITVEESTGYPQGEGDNRDRRREWIEKKVLDLTRKRSTLWDL